MVTENGIQSDGNTSFLRAARAGNLDKVLEHLKNNIEINTCNANGLNALHLASKDGHITVVSELLARGAIVDAATKKGNTALHIASLAGQEEVVKLLIQHNASVNVQSQNGFTPLYMAAQENHDSVVKLLLANGANQSLATEDGFTPLAVAMQQGHDKVVAVLLESDTRGKVRLPALHIAAKKDDVKAATLLLENDHNPDVTSKSGFTPLHIASHYGNEGIANLLIQKGADVNYAAKHNISPLHVAAKWGKTNMVSLLLEKGSNIESRTRDGLTPLHCAARSGHEQVVDMLLERGAPISSKTKNGLAPLHMAAQGEHVDAARILLYHRAPVDEVTVDYLTALHVAAHCGHVRVAKLLLDRNADANARALNGFTPLHIACKKNRIKVVELLLKHGASISATTESGLTPLHVASFMGCMNIVIYLLQHEASPDIPTVRGETPLHLAARANQTDIIRILLRNGAQVDARAREQQTPLHIASRLGNVDIVMLLLQHGAQVDAVTKDMYTALHIAAKEGQDEVTTVLLENGAKLDATTKKGFTPLHLTAKYGHIKVAESLVQKSAPIDAQGKNGVTPLHVATHYDHQNVALLLLEKGASPHATAKNGHTPLHIAARKNQMDIATSLLEYGALANAESKAGFTPLHLSSQEGNTDMTSLLLEHKANPNHQARNGLTPIHLCAQEDRVNVAQILVKHGADIECQTKSGYTPLHVASHFGQANMVRYLLQEGVGCNTATGIGYTPMHQAAQQGHCHIVHILLENSADPNALTTTGQTPLHIAQKLGYISVLDSLKSVTDEQTSPMSTSLNDEKYRVVAPEAMHETFMSDSEEEGGEDTNLSDQPYRYLTVDEMKSLGDDSLPIDVTRDERMDSNKMIQSSDSATMPPTAIEDSISPQHVSLHQMGRSVVDYHADNINIDKHPQHVGKLHWRNFLVSFLVDARGGAMRGCRHSGVRIIIPARSAAQPTRITCRYVKPQRTLHPPPLMEGEALASRVLELGPVSAKFLGPVIMEVPHFASLRGKEREIVILRSDNGETWREHSIDQSEEIISEVLTECLEPEDIAQMDELGGGRICRFVTYDFPQYFAVISRIRQEVHAIGPEGGMVSSTVVPQVQAVFPQGALTKKIKVGLQAQPIDPDLTAKLLGRGVAVSPVVTVEPRRRKFHKAITLSMPAPRAHSQGMINQYSGNAPTLRLLCSITGGTTRAQWEDVTGSTPLTFVNDCVSFTTTVSARFWLMDCRNISEATKMATELYKEAIHVPFMAKFVVFSKRTDPLEARLRVFCMTDDREDKTLEHQEHYTEVAKSRDVEVLEDKLQYIELAGNLIPVTKSGEQLQLTFKAFRENRLPFSVRVKDQHADTVGRTLFMREPKIAKGEPPQQPICILNIVLPETIIPETINILEDSQSTITRTEYSQVNRRSGEFGHTTDLRIVDISNLLGEDWLKLAPELGIYDSDIENIVAQYPTSTAQQAQAMLRLFQARKHNDLNILENGLRAIERDDIVDRCIRILTTTTTSSTTVIMRKAPGFTITKRETTSDGSAYDEADHIKDSESMEDLSRTESKKQFREREDKYSAEEKIVEDSESDEENVDRTVAEKRKMIEKRLSCERQIPASTQKKEIVEEIITIKRQSLIDDTRAKHEEEILMQKPIDNSYKTSSNLPEPVIKLKTTHLKDGSAVSKTEFDKELQDKFKTTLKDVDNFEHKFVSEDLKTETIVQQTQVMTTNIVDLKQKEEKLTKQTTTEVTKIVPEKVEKITVTKVEEKKKSQIPVATKTTQITKQQQINDKTTKITGEQKYQEEVKEKSDSVVTFKEQRVSSASSDSDIDFTSTMSVQKSSTKLVDDIIEEAATLVDKTKTSVIDVTTTKVSEIASTADKSTTQISKKSKTEIIEAETIVDHKRRTIEETISEKFVEESKIMERKFMEFAENSVTKKTHGFTEQIAKTPPPSPIDENLPSHDDDDEHIQDANFLPDTANDKKDDLQKSQTSTFDEESDKIPKPTPRLSKSSTTETNTSLETTSQSSSSKKYAQKPDDDDDDDDDEKFLKSQPTKSDDTSDSYQQRKQFWETLDTAKKSIEDQQAPVPKPRSQMTSKDEYKSSVDTDTSSIRSIPDLRQDTKEDDSIVIEERLEDESFPMTDSDYSDHKERSRQVSTEKPEEVVSTEKSSIERITTSSRKDEKDLVEFSHSDVSLVESLPHEEISRTTQEKQLLPADDEISQVESQSSVDGIEEKPAKFYIGDSIENVIIKTSGQQRDEFAFDNMGYQGSQETEEAFSLNEQKHDFVHDKLEIYDDEILAEKPVDLKSHVMFDETLMETVEKSEIETTEKTTEKYVSKSRPETISFAKVEEKPKPKFDDQEYNVARKPVVHSPPQKSDVETTEKHGFSREEFVVEQKEESKSSVEDHSFARKPMVHSPIETTKQSSEKYAFSREEFVTEHTFTSELKSKPAEEKRKSQIDDTEYTVVRKPVLHSPIETTKKSPEKHAFSREEFVTEHTFTSETKTRPETVTFTKVEEKPKSPVDDPDYTFVRKPVLHSPIQVQKDVFAVEKPIDISEPSITPAQATAIEILNDIETELKKPALFENFSDFQPQKTKQQFAELHRTLDELAVEQTLAEVKESLDAVQDELIESVKDGRHIKQSPSEFEFKVLPSTKYVAPPILEEQQTSEPVHQPISAEKAQAIIDRYAPKEKEKEKEREKQKENEKEREKQKENEKEKGKEREKEKEKEKVEVQSIVESTSVRPSIRVDTEESSAEESLNKLDVVHRKSKGPAGSNRWSVTDIESSSGESHYHSFESRPASSDVENILQYPSSEYDTAGDHSMVPGSTEYHSAMSTLNSRTSMKSFDSESSGNLASIEVSEASETLVPSTMEECELITPAEGEIEMDEDKCGSLEDKSPGILIADDDINSTAMKRSHEMLFREFQKVDSPLEVSEDQPHSILDVSGSRFGTSAELGSSFEDSKYSSMEEHKFASSLEDGSILSISVSSTSNLDTVMENIGGSHDMMGSLIGSFDSAKIYTSRTSDDGSTMTPTEGDSGRFESMMMLSSTVTEDNRSNVNTQITTTTTVTTVSSGSQDLGDSDGQEPVRKRGHRRNDSTSVFPGALVKGADSKDSNDSSSFDEEVVVQEPEPESSEAISSEKDETHGESSDSDYDRYETEYSRSFRSPQVKGKGKDKKIEKDDLDVKGAYSPSHSIIETIVEDVTAEIELDRETEAMYIERKMLQQQQYDNIPDIQVTEELMVDEEESEEPSAPKSVQKPDSPPKEGPSKPIKYAHQVEYKMSEDEFQELIEKKYKAQMSKKYDLEEDSDPEKVGSPSGSDSFEMLEQPDLTDEFVIVEEVAREAHEMDMEGKSLVIKPQGKMIKKHDEELEKMIIKSAPASTDAAAYQHVRDDLNFEFEESPPLGSSDSDSNRDGLNDIPDNGFPLVGSKKWVEMQLNENLRYPYELERGILEDIKEEDTDFEVGSSRISSFKDSFSSSTPDYDTIVRKLHSKDHDTMSMSSLQEFESLEQVISLENRKKSQGSQDSLSNGSYNKQYVTKTVHGDDISVSSLKQFEGLENACLEAHLLEIKAKEEAALLLSRSDESNKSDSSNGKKSSDSPRHSTRSTTITTTVVKSSNGHSQIIEQTTKSDIQHSGSSKTTLSHEEESVNLMEQSTDSLDSNTKPSKSLLDKDSSLRLSSDSLDISKTNIDLMTSSVDSIEVGKNTTKSSRSDPDSIELLAGDVAKSDSIDSIELAFARLASNGKMHRDSLEDGTSYEISTSGSNVSYSLGGKQVTTSTVVKSTTTTSTTSNMPAAGLPTAPGGSGIFYIPKDISNDSIKSGQLLTSTESIETSSTATNATYQNENDSQMSGSMTSCDSNTLIDTLDTNFGDFTYTTTTTTYISEGFGASSSSSDPLNFMEERILSQRVKDDIRRVPHGAGDAAIEDNKESEKEKSQNKTTEKED